MVRKINYESEHQDKTNFLKGILIFLILIFISIFGFLIYTNLQNSSSDLPLVQRLLPSKGFNFQSSSQDIDEVVTDLTNPPESTITEQLTGTVDTKLAELTNQEKLNSDLLASGKAPAEVIMDIFYNDKGEVFALYNLQNASAIAKIIDFRWVVISEWNTYPDCVTLDSYGVPYKISSLEISCQTNGVLRSTSENKE